MTQFTCYNLYSFEMISDADDFLFHFHILKQNTKSCLEWNNFHSTSTPFNICLLACLLAGFLSSLWFGWKISFHNLIIFGPYAAFLSFLPSVAHRTPTKDNISLIIYYINSFIWNKSGIIRTINSNCWLSTVTMNFTYIFGTEFSSRTLRRTVWVFNGNKGKSNCSFGMRMVRIALGSVNGIRTHHVVT